jgi:hypothetical protein
MPGSRPQDDLKPPARPPSTRELQKQYLEILALRKEVEELERVPAEKPASKPWYNRQP